MNQLKLNNELFRLGDFIVDPEACTVTRDGQSTHLQPKIMQVLLCLAANPGHLVTKETLLEEVWPGVFVVDSALRRCIYLLRKAFADVGDDPDYLETVPRRGYRLLHFPEALTAAETSSPAAPEREAVVEAYRGLQVYEPAHAAIFFGRQNAIEQVLRALQTQTDSGRAFVLILGPSGSGKSSLARAGVLPALRARSAHDELRTLIFQISESHTDPLRYLAQKLIDAVATEEASAPAVTDLVRQLEQNEESVVEWLIESLGGSDSPSGTRLLFLFDQLEELFSLDNLDTALRDRLVSLMYSLARCGAVSVVATMRSEFYPQFIANETLRFLKGQYGQVDVLFPSATEIGDIVREPARLAGLNFESDETNGRLNRVLTADAARQPNSLPLLQFALRELELRSGDDKLLRHEHYRQLGSLDGCLSNHAERVFASLSATAQKALPDLLERLVVADPRNAGRVLRKTVRLAELEQVPGCRDLSRAFIDARLLTSFLDRTTREPSLHIAHEAVFEHWPRARDWVQQNYAEIRFRSWLDEMAQRWREDDRPAHYLLNSGKALIEAERLTSRSDPLPEPLHGFIEASSARANRRGLLRGAVTVFLAVLTVASLGLWQTAQRNSERAERATQRAETTTDFMVSVFEGANPGNTGGRDLTASELLDRARLTLPTAAQVDPESRAALQRALSETYLLIGDYDTADELLASTETLLPELEKSNPRLAAQLLLEFGGLRKDQNRLEESEAYLRRALAMANESGDDLIAANTINIRGILHQLQGQFEDAGEAFDAALERLDRAGMQTRDSLDLRATFLNNAGSAQLMLGNLDRADEIYRSALRTRQDNALDNTAGHSEILTNLGALRRRQGRYGDAIELYDQAIALRTKLHGENHPSIANLMVNKASAELLLGRGNDAATTARSGLRVVEQAQVESETIVALLHAKLITATWLSGQSIDDEIVTAANAAIPVMVSAYGNDHSVVLETRAAVNALRIDSSSGAEAENLASQCATLSQLMNSLAAKRHNLPGMPERLSDYFDRGGACS